MAEEAKNEDIEQLREQYTSLYGKPPSGKARAKFLQEKINEKLKENENAKVNQEGDQKGIEKAPVQQLVAPNVAQVSPPPGSFEFKGQKYPHLQGKMYAVILKGGVRYFSKGSIDIIYKDIQVNGRNTVYSGFELPKGSPYVFEQKKRGA